MKIQFFIITTLLFLCLSASSQSVIGVWKAIDDVDGLPTSHVEIYEKDGKVFGKIVKVYDQPEDILCELCPGNDKNQPVVGLDIIKNMKKDGDQYKGGTIMDPENGKVYKSKMGLNGDGTFWVRGFIGFSLLGRTQTWHPVAD